MAVCNTPIKVKNHSSNHAADTHGHVYFYCRSSPKNSECSAQAALEYERRRTILVGRLSRNRLIIREDNLRSSAGKSKRHFLKSLQRCANIVLFRRVAIHKEK